MEEFLRHQIPKEVEINNFPYKVKVLFLNKRNSSAYVNNDVITLRVSDRLSKVKKKEHLIYLYNAIVKRIEKSNDVPERSKAVNDQDIISVNGKQYYVDLKVVPRSKTYSKLRGNRIVLRVPSHLEDKEEHIRMHLKKRIINDHYSYVKDIVFRLNGEHFQKDINNLRLKEMKSRWGSCSPDKNISINSKLLNAPRDVMEYVCIHELAHLVELNHSKRFWRLVEKAMPNYKEARRWLSKNGSTLKTF